MLYVIALFVLVGVGYVAVANVTVCLTTKPYRLQPDDVTQGADCILVLGCLVHGEHPSGFLADRLERAYQLYSAGVAPKLLLSGDNGQVEYNELQAMYTYMIQRGVPEGDIFLDYAGFNTYNSARRARDIFLVRSCVVVTQGFHLPRAVYDLRAMGIDAVGVEAMPRVNPRSLNLKNTLRETAGRSKDFIYAGLIQPQPVFGGAVHDIGGDGRSTHDGVN